MTSCLVVGVLAAAAALFLAPRAEGCGFPVLVPYGAPLEKMVPMHPPHYPEGPLPFGPRGVKIGVPVPTVMAGSGGKIGLALSGPEVKLNWTVISELRRVRRGGVVTRLLRTKRRRVHRVVPARPDLTNFSFSVSGRPSFYRVDVTFFDVSGARLGKYAEYFRILKHRTEYRETVSPVKIHGGEVLTTRTENPGTTGLSFGNDYAIDRFQEGMWRLDPLTPKGFPGIGITIFGGVSYDCKLGIPVGTPPGHYRFRKKVEAIRGRPRTIAADFFVVP
jgi:hypothetical protein